MTPTALLLSVLNALLAAAVLAGLWARRRIVASLVLPAYLAFLVVERPPTWFWPERFYTWPYWAFTDLIEAALRLALAVELLRGMLGNLPVSRRVSNHMALGILAAALLATLFAPQVSPGTSEWVYFHAARLAWQVTFASGWLFATLLVLAMWYGVPLERLHREVVAGLALWALLQAFRSDLAALDVFLGRQTLQRVVYTGVLFAWARAAWEAEEPTPLGPAARRLLQPWRLA